MLDSLDGNTGLDPAGFPIGEVIPSFGILVDGVGRARIVCLHYLPRPCPGEIGKIPFLLRVLVAVDSIERLEYSVFLHTLDRVLIGLNIYDKSRPLSGNGPHTYWNCLNYLDLSSPGKFLRKLRLLYRCVRQLMEGFSLGYDS